MPARAVLGDRALAARARRAPRPRGPLPRAALRVPALASVPGGRDGARPHPPAVPGPASPPPRAALRAGDAAAGGAPGAPAHHGLRVDAPGSRRAARRPAGADPRDPERRRRALRARRRRRRPRIRRSTRSACRARTSSSSGTRSRTRTSPRLLDAFAGLPPGARPARAGRHPAGRACDGRRALRRAGPRRARPRPGPGAGARPRAALPERHRRGVSRPSGRASGSRPWRRWRAAPP